MGVLEGSAEAHVPILAGTAVARDQAREVAARGRVLEEAAVALVAAADLEEAVAAEPAQVRAALAAAAAAAVAVVVAAARRTSFPAHRPHPSLVAPQRTLGCTDQISPARRAPSLLARPDSWC